ncbi:MULTISPECIES: biotin transporter BioY [Ligilactobacillus]|uniref:Biotin transporter n=3 Tax=Ligilactobacillus salivarius TaxID=1624 RepID=A0A1D7TQ25_9LACO|nr:MULTISPECIES: biotin transporter BioY [Ligilactobacillus]AOO73076.1 biotin biosynthesis protein BioY [Ligilactobacillus salivarius]AYC11009.1 Biotin transporter BioY [Ligilactobacillus salivarius]EGL98508.1 substrate-specific component BioY of biotin ECF transporter [Ligilactobacillus salivarius NIAS840]EGM52770.1 BioY protein [Ligilactobacillus salivarius GJ-24]MBM6956176.1 biotin transporter BioY [Ligilactobacillus salivarius]
MKTKNVALIAMMTAIIIVLGFVPPIPLGFIPVPIVLQNMGIMLAGAILGSKRGFLSVIIFLLLVAAGFPLMTGGGGGVAVFVGATAGYIYAYPFAAALIGYGLKKFSYSNFWLELLVVWVAGVLFIDVLGAVGLTVIAHMPFMKALIANLVFIPGDTIKALVVVLIYRRLKKMNVIES